MARSPRLFIPNAIYHVYCRTARGEMVFSKPDEAREFVDVVADVKRLHGFEVLAWCLMGNHYHIVIRTQGYPLWRSMARIQSRVARGHNRRRRILGRLWQSRYKARVVLDDTYYRQLLAYVHLNPVAAKLVVDPAAHPWSGHSALIGQGPATLVDVGPALVGFGETLKESRKAYLKQVRLVAEAKWLDADVRKLPWWEKVSNDDQLVEEDDAQNAFDFRGKAHPGAPSKGIDLELAASLICEATGTSLADLCGRSTSVGISLVRKALATLVVDHLGHSVADIANHLQKHPGSVSRWLKTPRRTDGHDNSVSEILETVAELRSDLKKM
jgi:putative transposase